MLQHIPQALQHASQLQHPCDGMPAPVYLRMMSVTVVTLNDTCTATMSPRVWGVAGYRAQPPRSTHRLRLQCPALPPDLRFEKSNKMAHRQLKTYLSSFHTHAYLCESLSRMHTHLQFRLRARTHAHTHQTCIQSVSRTQTCAFESLMVFCWSWFSRLATCS